MNRLPKVFYRVMVTDPTNLGYRDIGSKTYADRNHADAHRGRLSARGIPSELWETATDWQPVPDNETVLDGQEPLW